MTLLQAIERLKSLGIIKNDGDISDYIPYKKAIISNYKHGRPMAESFMDAFNKEFAKHGVIISNSTHTLSVFNSAKKEYESKGYSPESFNTIESALSRSTNATSYAILEMICRVVSLMEKRPLEEVRAEGRQLTHEKLTTVEELARALVV